MAILVNTDDFSGNCGMTQDTYADYNLVDISVKEKRRKTKFPLLQTINDAIGVAMYEIFQETEFEMQ